MHLLLKDSQMQYHKSNVFKQPWTSLRMRETTLCLKIVENVLMNKNYVQQ